MSDIQVDALWALAWEVLETAELALPVEVREDLDRYVSMCEPAQDCCNILVTWVESVDVLQSASPFDTVGSQQRYPVRMAARVNVALWTTQPTVDDTGRLPSTVTLNEAAYTSYQHAWLVQCGLMNLASAGLSSCRSCSFLEVPTMVCDTPTGGCGGWRWTLSVEV